MNMDSTEVNISNYEFFTILASTACFTLAGMHLTEINSTSSTGITAIILVCILTIIGAMLQLEALASFKKNMQQEKKPRIRL